MNTTTPIEFDSDVTLNGEEETPVHVTVNFTYDSGEFVEGGHPFNGYGAGWDCDSIEVDFNGANVTKIVSDKDIKRLIEEGKERLF